LLSCRMPGLYTALYEARIIIRTSYNASCFSPKCARIRYKLTNAFEGFSIRELLWSGRPDSNRHDAREIGRPRIARRSNLAIIDRALCQLSYGPQSWCRGQDSNLRRFLFVREAVSTTHTTPAFKLARGAGIKPAASTFGRSRSLRLSYPRNIWGRPRTSTRILFVRTEALCALS
jgi:hypothetical protein